MLGSSDILALARGHAQQEEEETDFRTQQRRSRRRQKYLPALPDHLGLPPLPHPWPSGHAPSDKVLLCDWIRQEEGVEPHLIFSAPPIDKPHPHLDLVLRLLDAGYQATGGAAYSGCGQLEEDSWMLLGDGSVGMAVYVRYVTLPGGGEGPVAMAMMSHDPVKLLRELDEINASFGHAAHTLKHTPDTHSSSYQHTLDLLSAIQLRFQGDASLLANQRECTGLLSRLSHTNFLFEDTPPSDSLHGDPSSSSVSCVEAVPIKLKVELGDGMSQSEEEEGIVMATGSISSSSGSDSIEVLATEREPVAMDTVCCWGSPVPPLAVMETSVAMDTPVWGRAWLGAQRTDSQDSSIEVLSRDYSLHWDDFRPAEQHCLMGTVVQEEEEEEEEDWQHGLMGTEAQEEKEGEDCNVVQEEEDCNVVQEEKEEDDFRPTDSILQQQHNCGLMGTVVQEEEEQVGFVGNAVQEEGQEEEYWQHGLMGNVVQEEKALEEEDLQQGNLGTVVQEEKENLQQGNLGTAIQEEEATVVQDHAEQQGCVGNVVEGHEEQQGFVGNVVQDQEEQQGFVDNVVQDHEEQQGFVGNVVHAEQQGFVGNVVHEEQQGFVGNVVHECRFSLCTPTKLNLCLHDNDPSQEVCPLASLLPRCPIGQKTQDPASCHCPIGRKTQDSAPCDRGNGEAALRLVRDWSHTPHAVFSLLIGRPLVVVGSEEERVREVVCALQIFQPNAHTHTHSHTHNHTHTHRVLPWSCRPLLITDLLEFGIIGLNRRSSHSSHCYPSMPLCLERYARYLSILDADHMTIRCPAYRGSLIGPLFPEPQSQLRGGGTYALLVQSALTRLAAQAFHHVFSGQESRAQEDDLSILNFLCEVIKLRLTHPDPSSVLRFNYQLCALFK